MDEQRELITNNNGERAKTRRGLI